MASSSESLKMARYFMSVASLRCSSPETVVRNHGRSIHDRFGCHDGRHEQVFQRLPFLYQVTNTQPAGAQQIHDRIDALAVLEADFAEVATRDNVISALLQFGKWEVLPRRKTDDKHAFLPRQGVD